MQEKRASYWIVPVAVAPALLSESVLWHYQFANSPGEPLATLDRNRQAADAVAIAQKIEAIADEIRRRRPEA